MGKVDEPQLPAQHHSLEEGLGTDTCCSRIFFFPKFFSLKCMFILLSSFAILFSTLFWILPPLHSPHFAFDANSSIKNTAIVQAYFRLEKPVSELISKIARLEYDINDEIGVPHIKVAVLSMHETGASNCTDVVFGFLPDPVNAPADSVSLAILKLSLIDLYLQQINLTLTNSRFGHTSSFEILEFPGGVSVVPKRFPWTNGQIRFNFTLNNSMSEVNENIVQLREQLRMGLHLLPDENVYVMLTNKNGSTRDPPITVDASITSVSGSLTPERLKQLAQNITRSPSVKNLGLNNTVFGKVKEVSLSSYLNPTIYASPPSPSPSPTQNDDPSSTPYTSLSPSHSPSPSTQNDDPSSTPYTSLSPSHSPSPSTSFPYPPDDRLPRSPESEPPFSGSPAPMDGHSGNRLPPNPSPAPRSPDLSPLDSSPPPTNGRTSHMSPAPSPLPPLSYGSNTRDQSSEAPSLPSLLFFHKKTWWFCIIGVLAFHLAWSDPLMWC